MQEYKVFDKEGNVVKEGKMKLAPIWTNQEATKMVMLSKEKGVEYYLCLIQPSGECVMRFSANEDGESAAAKWLYSIEAFH